MARVKRYAYTHLLSAVRERLQAAGVPQTQAEVEAELMVEADLLEVPSHGVRMLPGLLAALESGRLAPQANFTSERNFGAISVINCGAGPGRFASLHAMHMAMESARSFGVGVCLAKNTSHWGRAHAYASRAAQAGFIGICTTNAMPTMAIGGAKKPVIGNNPLAIGIPRQERACPIVLDIAMSQAAVGKVNTWLREGKTPPNNWGINAAGEPTNDAAEILKGAVLPFGGHKGAGLAVMLELITAALAGAAFTQEIAAADNTGLDTGASKLFIALHPSAFIDDEQFDRRVNDFLQYLDINAAPFLYPGARGWQAQAINRVQGVPIHQEIVQQLARAGLILE